jgi:cation-transporting P-type ATPase I
VLGLPDPEPLLLTAWHALEPEVVYGRLTAGARAFGEPPSVPPWRRRLDDAAAVPALSAALRPARLTGRLLTATRRELADPLTPVLAVGAAASAILGSSVDALLVAGVMGANALVGGAQRLRAETAAAELFAEQVQLARRVVLPATGGAGRRLAAARDTGRTLTLPATRLRPGDVIDLKAPDVVPADARLLVADGLEVDESSLTGESLPVAKSVDSCSATGVADRSSMVFEGGTVVAGTARAIVVATGSATAARRAVGRVTGAPPATGVQARLKELTGKALPMTLAGGGAVTGLSLLRRQPLRAAVADGVAIAVAAVPEGLPLVATMAQLAAARRLSARGILVRAPRAVEALGRVDTVCFDKTGTLTENRLRVVALAPAGTKPGDALRGDDVLAAGDRVAGGSSSDRRAVRARAVLRAAARACPLPGEGEGHAHATDEAVIEAAGATAGGWEPRLEVPFESSRGYAAAVGVERGAVVLALKGSPEVVLDRCGLGRDARRRAEALVQSLAGQGLRVLAVASGALAGVPEDGEVDALASGLRLVGFVGLADTPRPTARPLLEQLTEAGIGVAVVTGDHPVTARAIGRSLGLPADAAVVTGEEFAALDDAGRAEVAARSMVFARFSPEQKVQVVEALRRAGRVTAMVGDGANDAAAIRLADVGIGVTSRGSTAARSAADLVLTGDDLTAVLDALAEGRSMWGSVRDAVAILLGGNAGEVAFTVLGTALGRRAPVSTRQLLLVNLLTDMFPALAVAVTPRQRDLPDDVDEAERERLHRAAVLLAPVPSLDRPLVQTIVTRGAATAAAASVAWTAGRWTPGTSRRASTMGLTALVGTQLAQTLVSRRHSPLVVATAAGSAAVLFGIVQTPGLSHFFGCAPLGPVAWGTVLASTAAATAASVAAPGTLRRLVRIDAIEGGLVPYPEEERPSIEAPRR